MESQGRVLPYEQFAALEFRVGRIEEAEEVPGTDKLLRLVVSFGSGDTRQVVSGIRLYFPDPAALVGRHCVFATNLAPRVIRGLESLGMILAAHNEATGSFALLEVPTDVPPGTRIN
jgi:methionyl-tRNA synthetase